MHSANFYTLMNRSKKLPAWPLAFVLGLGACGYHGSADQSNLKAESTALSFASWCESWSILCESQPSPTPNPVELDAQTWTAITKVADEALANTVALNVTRAEIDSPQLSAAFQSLGLTSELNEFKASLDSHQWESIGLEGKSLVSRAAAESSVVASNGLGLNTATALTVSLGADATVSVNGLNISSAASGVSSELKTIGLGEANSLNFGLTSETVQNVPFEFLENTLVSALGFESPTAEPAELTAQQVIGAAYPLLSWANKPQRTISLNRKFFTVAGTEFSPVLSADSNGPAILNALSALNTFVISATAGKNVVQIGQVSGAKLECNVNNGTAKVMLDKDFGLKRYYEVDGGIGLEFFGVKASAKLALGIPLTLKRVELRADKITILDIPIIGKVDVPLKSITESSGGEDTKIACTK
ncbi:MAG: hypothetical protein EOP07_21635 [Proteobacteria bacterium]|nr:MAG: hypothetical protein EOP07_21635 [Pseudomonadota bacterium]